MKNKGIYILAVVFGLLTSYLIYDYLITVEKKVTNIQYEQVAIVTRDVLPKTIITSDMVQLQKIPQEHVHPQAVRTLEGVTGNITTAPLVQGEQLLKPKFAKPNDARQGLAYAVPIGKRAITVPVDEVSGVGGFVKPGDHVDIIAVVNVPDTRVQKDIPYSLVVLQDIQVLAVGKTVEDVGDGKNIADQKTITLAVTVDQSLPLMMAGQKGVIRLMLRSPVDNATVWTKPFKAEDFIQ